MNRTKKRDMISGGFIFLGLTLVYFFLSNIIGVIKTPERIGMTLLATSISYLIVAFLIPGQATIKGKKIIVLLVVCILITVILYLFINNTVAFSVLSILTWLIGGSIILFELFKHKTVD